MKMHVAVTVSLCACSLFADRQVQDFNADWRFRKDSEDTLKSSAADVGFDDQAWQKVRLPHDWAISGPFNPQGDGGTAKLPWRGAGWYRKTFSLDAKDGSKRVYLDFDGVMAYPEVYVNGQKAGGWDYGYIGFRVDITPFVAFDKSNVVAVKADTRNQNSRWYPGAGIYRKVTLTLCDPLHVAYETTFVTSSVVSDRQADVNVASAVTNCTDGPVKVSVTIALIDPSGKTVAKKTRRLPVPAHEAAPFAELFLLKAPRLWDTEAPNLYQARVTIACKNAADTETTRFGIRSFSFPADDGFHLNGRRVQLKGVDLHSDLGPLGMAFNRSAMRRELAIMKDMGFNALRTSHNCPAPDVLDLCDEMGIFVWDECFDKWEYTAGRRDDQNLEEYISRNLRQFARRDRNHPCVFVWSIGNEIGPAKPGDAKDPGMTEPRCTLFREVIRGLDTTRPVGIGCCHSEAVGMGIFENLDITGWNYRGQYDNIKRKYPDKPVLYSESASALSSYGYYALPPPKNKTDYSRDLEVCSYDHNAAPWSDIPDIEFARMERDRYCGGEFVWTGFDYLGEPTPFDGGMAFRDEYPKEKMARSAYFGIVDLCGIPKDRFYLYRSHWNTHAVTLHILPHWNWPGKEGQKVPVYVYTSGDSAELFLNGRSLGRRTKGQSQPKPVNLAAGKAATAVSNESLAQADPYYDVCDTYRLRWLEVVYAPGELKAVAYKNGAPIAEAVMKTAGKPVAVKLTPEQTAIPADGEGLVFVQVDVVDAAGVRDPRATNPVRFSLTGPGEIVAVGNGNPRGLDAFTETARHPLYFGKAVAVVRRRPGQTGPVTLTASADGLAADSAVFR